MSRLLSTASVTKTLLRGAAGTGVAVVARAAGALILNKVFATLAPPGGLSLLAQFQNLMALVTTLPNDGTHVGVVKYLAPLRPGSPRYRAWLGAAVALNLAVLATIGGLAGWWAGSFSELLGGGAWALLLAALGLVTGQALLGAALLAAGRLRAYVIGSVALALLGTAAAAGALGLGLPLPAVLLAYVLGQALALLPTAGLAAQAGLLRGLRLAAPLSRTALRGLSQFLLMGGSTLLFGKAVDFALRTHLLNTYGPARTDFWQAVAKLSDNYTMVAGAVFSSVYYPRLAALAGQPAAARAYVRQVLLLLAPTLAMSLGLIFVLRDWLLPLLFSARLLAARDLLAPQLLADWAKLLSWVLIFQLTARARTGAYVAVQAGSALVFALLLAGLLPRFGLAGALWANAGRYGLLLLACGAWELRRGPMNNGQ